VPLDERFGLQRAAGKLIEAALHQPRLKGVTAPIDAGGNPAGAVPPQPGRLRGPSLTSLQLPGQDQPATAQEGAGGDPRGPAAAAVTADWSPMFHAAWSRTASALAFTGGGLRGAVNPAAPACGRGGLPRRSVPIGRYSVGVDARVDAVVLDGRRCSIHPCVS
jgi:hypothetical protein